MTRRGFFAAIAAAIAVRRLPVVPMTAGGAFRIARPTLMLVGDDGPEAVVFTGRRDGDDATIRRVREEIQRWKPGNNSSRD